MPEMLQRVSEGKRRKTLTNWQWREFAVNKAHRGRVWKMMVKEKEQRGFERRPKKKGKQEHRVSGSWNRQPESTWSKRNVAMTLTARTEW